MSGNVWQDKQHYKISLKGAPERVISHSKLRAGLYSQLEKLVHSLTGQGYRVIALSEGTISKPIKSLAELKPKQTELIGILAIADVLRPEAKAAIATAQNAGVAVKMITGDHFETAFSIGKQLGMVEEKSQVFDSRLSSNMKTEKLSKAVQDSFVFSRVIPEDKFKILSILKKKEITAMTGDGVNDVPALANAHVGIAMGSGSQIAKEAGDIVLLDNNFRSIVTAMREGRIIDSNIRRMLFYLLSTNAGQIITLLAALAVGLPLPIVAVQILWINLVTDTLFVIPLGLEPGEKDVMNKPPRAVDSPILDRFTIIRMLLVSTTMAILSLAIFTYFDASHSEEYARTMTFAALVVMQWANAFNARSERHSIFERIKVFNGKFYLGLCVALILQVLALFGPLKQALNVVTVPVADVAYVCLLSILAICMVSEVYKLAARVLNR
jgi:Ca2+-transporting ATPase